MSTAVRRVSCPRRPGIRRAGRLLAVLAALAVAGWPAVAAATPELAVEIVEPRVGVPLFDRVTVAVRLAGEEPVERVEVFVDGRSAGVLRRAPWRLEVDVGSDNREHRIEAVAHGAEGSVARSLLVSPRVEVHERLDLELQQLYLTVTDRKGNRVVELDRGAFKVRDDGRTQEIVTLEGGEIPFTAVLLVDSSGSMAGAPLAAAMRGVRRFVGDLAENDEAKLLVTSDRVLHASPWSRDPALFGSALELADAGGGSAILDHLFLSLQLLEERLGRRVLILLTDGWDHHSSLTVEQLRRVSRRSQAMVYWVRLGSGGASSRDATRSSHAWVTGSKETSHSLTAIPLSVWRDREGKRRVAEALEAVVEESGGRIVPVATLGAIEAAFGEILAELREQIAVGYYPDPRRNDGSWREVKVKVKGRGLDVRTRKGYVDRN